MRAGAISGRLRRIPPFTSPRARKAFLRRRDQAGRARRHAAERLGLDRYSRPALFEMDVKLERYLPERDGFFVEAGGNDGFLQSNTYYFERFKGWRGVLVEPIPELYELCVRERPNSQVFNYALVPPDQEGQPVQMHYGGLMSIVSGVHGQDERDRAHAREGSQLGWDLEYDVSVPGRTLGAILEEAGAQRIDLLSLDVEGFEASVLEGLDFDRFAPRFALIEIRDEAGRPRVEEVLGPRYESVEQLSPYDVLYARG